MGRKKETQALFDELITGIKLQIDDTATGYIPDIITFCENEEYLGLNKSRNNPISLHPVQKIVLKVFYRGTIGNEKIKLTKEEIELLKEDKLEYIIDKYETNSIFRELMLVWGRRCVGENTKLVDPATGKVTAIGELYDDGSKNISSYSLNEDNYSFEVKENTEIIYNGIEQTYRVVLQTGRSIEVTDNHPFLTQDGWKELKNLKAGDQIAAPRKMLELTYDNILWLPIKKIKKAKKQRTFDLHVPHSNCHNFVANDILLHNSGKNVIGAIIAAYEAMRILEIPGGNPFKYYQIKEGDPIYILTVANSSQQANILFNEIKTNIINAPYFQNKIDFIDSQEIGLLTPYDKARNKILVGKGIESQKGCVRVFSGHSNSDTLLGKRCMAILLDEVASYKTTAGSSGGDVIYRQLTPCTLDFKINRNGKDMLDSKIISISAPKTKEGKFWKMYQEAFEKDKGKKRLVCRLPTWKVNLNFSEELCREEFSFMSPQEFDMEIGAQFQGIGGEKFVADEVVDAAIDSDLGQRQTGVPGQFYFAHVDPASTSHNYALVILHVEHFIKATHIPETGKIKREKSTKFVIDHIMVWSPIGEHAIDFKIIDNYVIAMSKRFRFVMVSYDAYESRASMQRLRRNGVPTRLMQFRKKYKVEVYRTLENLLISGNLVLPGQGPYAKLAEMELKHLKRRWSPTGGFKIGPDPEGDVKTDDVSDAIAGACGLAENQMVSGLPRPESVYLPILRGGNGDQSWNIGRGTYNQQQYDFISRKLGN